MLKQKEKVRIISGIILIALGFLTVCQYKAETNIPLNEKEINYTIQLLDETGCISNDEDTKLRQKLEEFENKTGTVPAAEFIYSSVWCNDYKTIDEYAETRYEKEFSDQDHILIIYSFGDAANDKTQYAIKIGSEASKSLQELSNSTVLKETTITIDTANVSAAEAVINMLQEWQTTLCGKSYISVINFLCVPIGIIFFLIGIILIIATLKRKN